MEKREEESRMFDLTGSLAVEGTEVVLQYRGINRAPEPLFVAHLPSDVRFRVYPNLAYCSLSPDGQQINFLLGDSPLPHDREVEFGVGAFFLKVPQGEEIKAELRLSHPLKEWNGYFPPNALVKTELVGVRKALLHVDHIQQDALTWMRPARIAPDYWAVAGPLTRSSIAFDLETPLRVAKRHDNFPRF